MRIKSSEKRSFWLLCLAGFTPDILLAFVISLFAEDSDQLGTFFLVFIGIQIIAFLLWIKKSIWGWITYKFYLKQNLSDTVYAFLSENKMPEPNFEVESVDDYLLGIIDDKEIDAEKRIKAALSAGELSGQRACGQMQTFLKFSFAWEAALKRFKNDFYRNRNETPPSEI